MGCEARRPAKTKVAQKETKADNMEQSRPKPNTEFFSHEGNEGRKGEGKINRRDAECARPGRKEPADSFPINFEQPRWWAALTEPKTTQRRGNDCQKHAGE
jgi:hypothetical protein